MDIQRRSQGRPVARPVQKVSVPPVTPVFPEPSLARPTIPEPALKPKALGEEPVWSSEISESSVSEVKIPVFPPRPQPSRVIRHSQPRMVSWWHIFSPRLTQLKAWARMGALGILLFLGVGGVYGFFQKNNIERRVEQGMEQTQEGLDALGARDYAKAQASFREAEKSFTVARRQTLYFPVWLAKPLTFIPGVSRAASGVLAIDGSKHLTKALQGTTTVVEKVTKDHITPPTNQSVSYLDTLNVLENPLQEIRGELKEAESSLHMIPSRDIPADRRMEFSMLQKGLPGVVAGIDSFLLNKPLVEELLGKNGPRIYLFLFQNNQELRPTGGFIGTYGILEFQNGHAKRFFIDGIFNPDGQLKENIVPPQPIQKISAGWSLHDSNWFPNFPTSAEKAIFFYEKTGGPTVDGVFTMTPTVMERLLTLTGPIELPEYQLVVDSNNFIPTIQEQVETKYDKVENKPKKVLGDLSTILLERVFALSDPLELYQVANILVEGMNEKQILLYTRNEETQKLIEQNGWSGKIDDSPHDYLSVVHTNINGFKTDGVIDDRIDHQVTIEPDGSVVAKTSITRVHNGGYTPYDWWNRVNSDYMRVYVPKGSQLINATGHTREFLEPPLDYELLGFKRDADVTKEEEAIQIDQASGTRVGEEFGKTVFGNWVYVSPSETVRVEYTYLLPFRVDPKSTENRSYSFLFQKQPGMKDIELHDELHFPEGWRIQWATEDKLLEPQESGIQLEHTTGKDTFWGVVFDSKQ